MEDLSILEAQDAHICARREHNELAPARPEVLHCYGVDFLSNKEVLEVFENWQPQQVEWLDDSSCNVIFEDGENVQKAMRELAVGEPLGPWTRTQPLSVGSKDTKKGKARRGGLKKFCLQLRVASEADRKDPTHSGHTDSVYYAHVKEQQAMQKQATELRRMKKRQRQMTPRHKDQTPSNAEVTAGPEQSAAAESSQAAPEASSPASKVLHGSILTTRLASCGLLDPLLFLKAPAQSSQGSSKASDTEPVDLKTSLKRAEAEYAAVLNPASGKAPAAMAKAAADRGRNQRVACKQREGTPGRPGGRDATPGRAGQQRGKKRRPVEQEPRPVSEAAPPQRKAELLPEVEAFLKKHGVRYKRYVLQRSFRSIKYAQQEAAKTQAMAQKQSNAEKIQVENIKPVEASKNEGESAWDQYMKVNKSFTSHGVFMQTVAWKVEGRRVLSVVPHPQMTDVEKVAKAVQKPVASVVQCKLKDISQETGFPVFVCPPFGYPPDADGRPPLLLVDSSVADLKKPLLFDCGLTGLCITVSEFLRSTRAACVENLAQPNPRRKVLNDPKPEGTARAAPSELGALTQLGDGKSSMISPASTGAASPEPAPEPAPITGDHSDLMEH